MGSMHFQVYANPLAYSYRKETSLGRSGKESMVGVPGYLREIYCFLWGTDWLYICYVEKSRPLLWSSGQSSWLQNGDVLCFLWGTNWIYICYVEESRPPLWSSGQSFWLQVQRWGFDFRRYQISWEVVALERGLNSVRRGGNPATKRLSYVTAVCLI
jgi:hypothetical protein